jgi:hypothetical protein
MRVKSRQWCRISASDSQQSIAKDSFAINKMIEDLSDLPRMRRMDSCCFGFSDSSLYNRNLDQLLFQHRKNIVFWYEVDVASKEI